MPVENSDRRRRQYVPLVTTFAHGRTAERLIAKFGRDGLLVWVCYLAACKRAPEQGVFEYVSEGEGWGLLGLRGTEPDFTLTDFFRVTGQLHKTSRRTRGQLTTIACTVWEDITAGYDRELDAARKRRKRGTKTPDVPPDTSGTEDGQSTDDPRTEVEGDSEDEKNPLPPTPAGRLFRLWQETWDHPRAILTEPRKRMVKRRLAEGFTEDTMRDAILGSKIDVHRWPERAEANAHTFELILRDAPHIETFAELVSSPPVNGNHSETEEQREQRLLARLRQLGPKEAA